MVLLIEIRKMESGLTKETKDIESLVWSKVNEGSHEIMSGHLVTVLEMNGWM